MGDTKPAGNKGSSTSPEAIHLITVNDVERGGADDGGPQGRAIPTDVNANDSDVSQLHDKLDDEKKRYDEDYVAVWKLRQNEANAPRKRIPSSGVGLMDWLLPRKPREYKLLAFVIFLFAVIVASFIVVYHIHDDHPYYIYRADNIVLNEKTLDLEISNSRGEKVLKGRLWLTRPGGRLPYDCTYPLTRDSGVCLKWKQRQRLHIDRVVRETDNGTCFQVQWEALSPDVTQMDCYDLGESTHWYGGGLLNSDAWPLERASIARTHFITGGVHDRDSFGPVLERYWMTSRGVAIIVDEGSPLDVSINAFDETINQTDQQFCLYSSRRGRHINSFAVDADQGESLQMNLNYTICIGHNIRDVHEATVPLRVPECDRRQAPAKSQLERIVWSTWSYFKTDFSASELLDHFQRINSSRYGAGGGLVMIDDGWEEIYGDAKFKPDRFPAPAEMIETLHQSGFSVSMAVQSQLNTDSRAFLDATRGNYLVKDVGGDVPGLTRWWNGPRTASWSRGVAGIIDASDEKASAWQSARLSKFKDDYNADCIHFSGGEIRSLPAHSTFNESILNENFFTTQNVKMATSFGCTASVSSSYKSQSLPALVRFSDSTSTWTNYAGLQSIIPSALALGLAGYPVFIPDAVGGSAFDQPPSKELYIRWLQITTFFPVLHFSSPPHHFDEETVTIARELIDIRKRVVLKELFRVLNSSIEKFTPLIRPLWWAAIDLDDAHNTATQFLVGDNLMVAPILDEGAIERNIFITPGIWEDQISDDRMLHVGPKTLFNYRVPLEKVAYFIRKDRQ